MLVVSQANSIRFAIRNSDLPNPENTLSHEEKFGSFYNEPYCQKFNISDTVTIQCSSDTATEPTVTIYSPSAGTPSTATLVNTYSDRYYFQFNLDLSSYVNEKIYIYIEQDGTEWQSENIYTSNLAEDLADGKIVRIDYENGEKQSDYQNFGIDYTTGISFFFYVEGVLRNYQPSGDDEIFTNIDEKELIESQMFIGRVLQTDKIPIFLTEMIWIASKHYEFFVNDLQYTAGELPDITDTNSNLKTLEYLITIKTKLGFNTDDRGITCEENEMVITRKISDLTSTDSFVVPAGYLMHDFICGHEATSLADYTFKAGTTVGGDNIITAFIGDVPITGGNRSIPVHEQRSFSADQTVYVEKVSGTGAKGKIWIQLIYNG